MFKLKRAYEEPEKDDGVRILVDKFWPRGVSKEDAKIDKWPKEIASTDDLRNKFHETENFSQFKSRYKQQLQADKRSKLCKKIIEIEKEQTVTLVYSSSNEKENNAVVLLEFLNDM